MPKKARKQIGRKSKGLSRKYYNHLPVAKTRPSADEETVTGVEIDMMDQGDANSTQRMAQKPSHSRENADIIRLDGKPTRALTLEIEKQCLAMCRDIKAIFSNGFKSAREQTITPVEFLFILKEKSSLIFKCAGNGEMRTRFENGEPLTTNKPSLKEKYQTDRTVVNAEPIPQVDLPMSRKRPRPLAFGERRAITEGQEQQLQTLELQTETVDRLMPMPKPVEMEQRPTGRGRGKGRGRGRGRGKRRVIVPSRTRSAPGQLPTDDTTDQSTMSRAMATSTSVMDKPASKDSLGDLGDTADEENTRICVAQSKRDFNEQATPCDQFEESEDEELTETMDSLYPVITGSYSMKGGLEQPLAIIRDPMVYSVLAVKSESLAENHDSHSVNLTDVHIIPVMPLTAVKREPALNDTSASVARVQHGSCENPPEPHSHVPAKQEILNVVWDDSSSGICTQPESVQMSAFPEDQGPILTDNGNRERDETHCQSSSLPNNIDEPFSLTVYEQTEVSQKDPSNDELIELDAETPEKTVQNRKIYTVDVCGSSPREQMGRQTAGRRKKHSVNQSSSKTVNDPDTGTQTGGNQSALSPNNQSCSKNSENDNPGIQMVTLAVGDLEDLLERKLSEMIGRKSRKVVVSKPVRDTVHAVVRSLAKMNVPVSWNFSKIYTDLENTEVKAKIVSEVKNQIGAINNSELDKAIRSYFLTLKANHTLITKNKKVDTLRKQRKLQRLTNCRQRRRTVLKKVSLPIKEKADIDAILVDNAYLSSEDSEEATDSSDDENIPKAKRFVKRPLTWRSDYLNDTFAMLDRKAKKITASTKGGAPSCERRNGVASLRTPPDDAPEWTMQTGSDNPDDGDLN